MASGGSRTPEEIEKAKERIKKTMEEIEKELEVLKRTNFQDEDFRFFFQDEDFRFLTRRRKEMYGVHDETRQDPFILELYLKALKEGKEEDRSIRINVVGNFGQGKTSLVRCLVGESIEGVTSTNGIECDLYKCQKEKDGTFSYVHESFGMDSGDCIARIAQTMSSQLHGRDGEHSKKRRVASLSADALSSEMEYKPTNPKKSKLLQDTEYKILKENLDRNKKKTEETHSQTFINFWDYAGQDTFYATHTIFHSRKAIYLLVFDLSLDLKDKVNDKEEHVEVANDKDMEYCIRYWVNSIHSFVGNKDSSEPHVILVGTHKDKLQGNDQEIESQAEEKFDRIRDLFAETEAGKHILPEEFAVDNNDKNDKSICLLRKTIIQVGERSNKELIPAKWIQLEKGLLKRKQMRIISMKLLMQIDKENEFPIDDVEQIKLFLKYHHNKGTLCYFDEEPISNDVVLDPQYLIDAFKCIMTSRRFCRKDRELMSFWKKLFKEAKLEQKLVDTVWKSHETQDFLAHKHILIEFLKKHHILTEAMAYDETKQSCEGLGWYIVPSLLRNKSSDRKIAEYLHGKRQTLTRFVLTFDNDIIVPTIYQRVIAATLGRWPRAQFQDVFLIYENLLVVQLDVRNNGMLEMVNNHIELTVVGLCSSVPVGPVIADGFRRFVEAIVFHELSKRQETVGSLKKPYISNLRCNDEIHGRAGSIRFIQQFPEQRAGYYPCPDSMSHELVMQKVLAEWFQERSYISNVPRQRLPDKILSKIACAIGQNWEFLGKQLDVTEIEIQHIKENHPHSVQQKTYYMLLKWNQRKADRATMDVLVEIIRSCPYVSVDWDVFRNVIDEITTNQ